MKRFVLVFNLEEYNKSIKEHLTSNYRVISEDITHFDKRTDGLKQAQDIIWVVVLVGNKASETSLVLKYGDNNVTYRKKR